jgi:hypothetical protein
MRPVNSGPKAPSRSRIRWRGASSHVEASVICPAIDSEVRIVGHADCDESASGVAKNQQAVNCHAKLKAGSIIAALARMIASQARSACCPPARTIMIRTCSPCIDDSTGNPPGDPSRFDCKNPIFAANPACPGDMDPKVPGTCKKPRGWVANRRGQVRRDRRPFLCDQRGLSGSRPRAADDSTTIRLPPCSAS